MLHVAIPEYWGEKVLWKYNDTNFFLFFSFEGWPRLIWFVIDGKHLAKPAKDWHPQVRDASAEIAYIEVIQYNMPNLLLHYSCLCHSTFSSFNLLMLQKKMTVICIIVEHECFPQGYQENWYVSGCTGILGSLGEFV